MKLNIDLRISTDALTIIVLFTFFTTQIFLSKPVFADCCPAGKHCTGQCDWNPSAWAPACYFGKCESDSNGGGNNCSCSCGCDGIGNCNWAACGGGGGGGNRPTATPAPWRIQGWKVVLSNFGDNSTVANQPVTVYKRSDPQLRASTSDSPFTIDNLSKVVNNAPTRPYTIGEAILNDTYSASVSLPENWDVFSTWCKNKTDCHTLSSPQTGNPVEMSLGREGGYVDLYWHFVAPPSNLKVLCNKYGKEATLSWNGPSDITIYPIRVDRYEVPNIPFVCDPNSEGPTNVCKDISGTSTKITVDESIDYGWWVHSGYFWNAVARSTFKCNPAPKAYIYIQAPNCDRYPGEYSWETPIKFDGYATTQGGLASSNIFIAKKCGNTLCEYSSSSPPNWCESAGGEMQYNASTQMGTFCKIQTANFNGTVTWTQHYEASWKPNEVGTYYALINAKSSNPADFQCSGNPRCEYSQSTLTKYGTNTCENGRYAACQLGGIPGKVGYPAKGGVENLWGESIEFEVKSTQQCTIPRININVTNREGTPVPVAYQGFTYSCGIGLQCYNDSVSSNVSSSSPKSIATAQGGAGISLSSNQVLLGVTPNPNGGNLNTKNNNKASPAPAYDRATWYNYWWSPYPDVPLRSVNFVVATRTPTPTHTPTPTGVAQLKVTGAFQQRTGKAGNYIYRNVNASNSLPFVSGVNVNNNTHWTKEPYTTTACATTDSTMHTSNGVKVGYTATYTFKPYDPDKGYCVPKEVNALGFKLPVEVTVSTNSMPESYSLLAPYKVDVTTFSPTVLDIPFAYSGANWIRLKDTSLTRPVNQEIVNKIPYIVDKFWIETATNNDIGRGDGGDIPSKNMISETLTGAGGFVPKQVTLNNFNKSSTNEWVLPDGYIFNTSGLRNSVDQFVEKILKTQGFQKVGAQSNLNLSPNKINVIPPGSSVGQINIQGAGGAAVLIASSDTGEVGDISITSDTGAVALLVIADNITIGKDVKALNGVYIAKGNINLSGNKPEGDYPIKIKGNVVTGGGMINMRSRADQDHARPSMFIQFDYDMYQKLMGIIGVVSNRR